MLNRQSLVQIKTRALRQRIWFKTLSRVERGIVDLTIKCVDTVRSSTLAGLISTIVSKMLRLLGGSFMKRAETAGHKIAGELCALGASWGNEACPTWKRDKRFIRFLGVNALNSYWPRNLEERNVA